MKEEKETMKNKEGVKEKRPEWSYELENNIIEKIKEGDKKRQEITKLATANQKDIKDIKEQINEGDRERKEIKNIATENQKDIKDIKKQISEGDKKRQKITKLATANQKDIKDIKEKIQNWDWDQITKTADKIATQFTTFTTEKIFINGRLENHEQRLKKLEKAS
ncbi:hypothetical protein ACFL56_02565 [Candidatus Margulisiibacteriota bacterium]